MSDCMVVADGNSCIEHGGQHKMCVTHRRCAVVCHEQRKSGFEDIPVQERCMHPQHDPPMHMVIPQGKRYRHICPGCGRELLIQPPQIRFSASNDVHGAAKRLVDLLDDPHPGLSTWHEACEQTWREMHGYSVSGTP